MDMAPPQTPQTPQRPQKPQNPSQTPQKPTHASPALTLRASVAMAVPLLSLAALAYYSSLWSLLLVAAGFGVGCLYSKMAWMWGFPLEVVSTLGSGVVYPLPHELSIVNKRTVDPTVSCVCPPPAAPCPLPVCPCPACLLPCPVCPVPPPVPALCCACVLLLCAAAVCCYLCLLLLLLCTCRWFRSCRRAAAVLVLLLFPCLLALPLLDLHLLTLEQDLDMMGHMNNIRYFEYVQAARVQVLLRVPRSSCCSSCSSCSSCSACSSCSSC